MTYDEFINDIENRRRLGNDYGSQVSERLLGEAGIVEEPAPFIHVAGTNGKGSCIAMIDAILREAGFRIGRFTSPHLEDFCERIVVDGVQISREDALRLGERVLRLPSASGAAMFDIAFMMAVLYFQEMECDFWLIETGLGGLHDSTNALGTPIISVITSIGLDHEDQLGHTVEKITAEKAGIIKEDSVCVTGVQAPAALEVIKRVCDEKGVFLVEMEAIDDDGLQLSLAGDFQRENAGIAMGVVNVLCDLGVRILPSDIDSGFKKALWPGRMELFQKTDTGYRPARSAPDLIIDGAHNIPGARALVAALQKAYPGETFHVCFGCAKDKAAAELIDILRPVTKDIIFTAAKSYRAKPLGELLELGRAAGLSCRAEEDSRQAVSLLHAMDDGVTGLICGSLYLIGEIRKYLQ